MRISIKKIYLLLSFFSLGTTYLPIQSHPVENVQQVVLWGHKLHSHTHSYIHWGFKRAFEYLGYKTLWLDKNDATTNIDFSNSLFITEGQVDQKIPIRDDCYYIIHNCEPKKYKHLLQNGHAIILQVYTHDCLTRNEPSFDFCFHYDLAQPIIYMPWATDLLPPEIDEMKLKVSKRTQKKPITTFIGTISHGGYSNGSQIDAFNAVCKKQNISFESGQNRSMEENIQIVNEALLAPAIQGPWQCEHGYIPCRIFKNISYGAMGITNNETVYKLFNKKIVYNADPTQLAHDAIQRAHSITTQEILEMMDFVRDKHTYVNRIERLFNFFEMVKTHKRLE